MKITASVKLEKKSNKKILCVCILLLIEIVHVVKQKGGVDLRV